MQTAKRYVGDIAAQTHMAMQRMQPSITLASERMLPSTPQQVTDYVDEMLEKKSLTPVSFLENAIGEDIEHLKAVEDFLETAEECGRELLTAEEQRLCDMATD